MIILDDIFVFGFIYITVKQVFVGVSHGVLCIDRLEIFAWTAPSSAKVAHDSRTIFDVGRKLVV